MKVHYVQIKLTAKKPLIALMVHRVNTFREGKNTQLGLSDKK